MERGSRRLLGDLETGRDDAGRVIVLQRRPPLLGEPSERGPAVVLAFPAERTGDGEPPRTGGGTPRRLAI